jgi:hypothetical protein
MLMADQSVLTRTREEPIFSPAAEEQIDRLIIQYGFA